MIRIWLGAQPTIATRNWREIDPRRPEAQSRWNAVRHRAGTCLGRNLGGAEKLSDVAVREGKQIKEFGYIDTTEPKPLIRLACQAKAMGAVSIVIRHGMEYLEVLAIVEAKK